ncbi:Tox-REase-5 domain-containing protein [Mycobacterium hubeiense]|uniref:Tox-REase-5 domain-containing protein n=1 Tax=Mycobacterium hubeiense TaxID=1867256 RepID=UPI001E56347B|nr:Tox-REase-5 domain-containing protein [Mycobacterium sp. QGD 101]
MSAAPSGRFTTRSAIEDLTTSDFADAAARWRTAADQSDEVFDRHRQNIATPGGTTWEGDAKDAALARATADGVVAGNQNGVVRESADIAENAVTDINAAQREALAAITEAENDEFTVGEDLSVTDTRRYDINTVIERNKAAKEHAEDIRWYAERLSQTVAFAERRLQEKAAELEGIRFDGEGADDGEGTVQLVDNKVKLNPHDKPAEDGKEDPNGKPEVAPEQQAPGQIGPFPVPKSVDDAASNPEAEPDGKPADTSDAGGTLEDLLLPDEATPGEPGEEKPGGLPPALSQQRPPSALDQILNQHAGKGDGQDGRYTKSPLTAPIVGADPSVVDRQAARVEAARQALDAAQAKLDAAAGQGYAQGAGAGPGRDVSDPLSQAVFDARRELTEQTAILGDLNQAAAETGGGRVPIPPLPENADVQAFPQQPPVLERSVDAFADGTKDAAKTVWDATMPDVGNMYDVATNWDEASAAERTQAVLDAAGMAPIPGGKILGEGIEHGLDALGGASHHIDDVPVGGHHTADIPAAPHTDDPALGLPGNPGSAPVQHSIAPDSFDPARGLHYSSGDPHYPGGWPPSTPDATWTKGNTDPGWHYVDRGPDKDWMPYQEQISGAERLPDGRIPEYARIDPETGNPVNFDGHTLRGDQEVFLDAKDGYAKLATEPGKPWTQGMERTILDEIPRQLRALPDGAALEVHVSDPLGAAAIRNLIEANDWFEVTVVYTPKLP